MITPGEIEKKAKGLWRSFLQAWLLNEAFFPREVGVGKVPKDDYNQLANATKVLSDQSKAKRGIGYSIEWETKSTRYGSQTRPRKIIIETEEDYLAIVRRKGKFQQFKTSVHLIRTEFPELEDWLYQHPFAVLKFADEWRDLLTVCQYFRENPSPNLYARELPIPVHTKFIEQHKGILRDLLDLLLPVEAINHEEKHFERRFGLRYDEPLIRVRFLDSSEHEHSGFPFHDISVPVSELAAWSYRPRQCLVVENKLTFLTLPPLPNTLALWGGGFRVQLLEHLSWLQMGMIFYWGDVDAHGFQILSALRHIFPSVVSVMMDVSTLERFSEFVVRGTPTPIVDLSYLSSEEQRLYQLIQADNIRLEQERITPAYAAACLKTTLH
jgi:hypothetical protein